MSFIHGRNEFNGGVYSKYGSRPGLYRSRANHVDGIAGALRNKPLLVAGCGYGYLVRALMEHNSFSDVSGCDASTYAVAQSRVVLGREYASHIFVADVRELGRDYACIVSEDLLPCAETKDEAREMAEAMSAHAEVVMHFVTPRLPSQRQDPRFLWLFPDEWKSIVGPHQVIVSGAMVL